MKARLRELGGFVLRVKSFSRWLYDDDDFEPSDLSTIQHTHKKKWLDLKDWLLERLELVSIAQLSFLF